MPKTKSANPLLAIREKNRQLKEELAKLAEILWHLLPSEMTEFNNGLHFSRLSAFQNWLHNVVFDGSTDAGKPFLPDTILAGTICMDDFTLKYNSPWKTLVEARTAFFKLKQAWKKYLTVEIEGYDCFSVTFRLTTTDPEPNKDQVRDKPQEGDLRCPKTRR
jgi:hypothetical protein